MVLETNEEAGMNSVRVRATLLALLCLLPPLRAAGQQNDLVAIRDLQTQQAAAWNLHDAAAYANLFTDDGDVVNVLGWLWRGRSEIRSKLNDAFTFVFRESTLTITDVQARFLSPTIAVAHVWWTLDGAKAPPGAPGPPRSGIQLQVLTKQSGRWLIASFRTRTACPRPRFPRVLPRRNRDGGPVEFFTREPRTIVRTANALV
jgi:uncharacterized protein (TIGR02246 family)